MQSRISYERDRETLLDALRFNLMMRWRHPANAKHWRTMARNKIRLLRALEKGQAHAPTR